MKLTAFLSVLLLAGGAAAERLTVAPDRPEALYRPGEQAVFTLKLTSEEGKTVADREVRYYLYGDDSIKGKGTLRTGRDGTAEVKTGLNRPGFIRLAAATGTGKEKVEGSGGAGFDPRKITPARPEPPDFDAYWAKAKQEVDQEPLRVKLTPVPLADAGQAAKIKLFDVELNCSGSGAPVRGYLALPYAAEAKTLPAVVSFQGAGVHSAGRPVGRALAGMIGFEINAHGVVNGRPREFYDALDKGELNGYRYRNMDDPEKIYFRGMFQRVWRALQFVKRLPEWDGRTLIALGGSQGGGQALAAAGLDPDVSCCVAYVPALCDHGGLSVGRESGWPRFHRGKGYDEAKVLPVADYVDAVNFARRIKADCFLSTGFVDLSCHPSSVYAAYNVIPAETKRIVNSPASDHSVPRSTFQAGEEFMRRHIEKMRRN
ncbi:acetylxylan esterase [Victivallis vadensis]|uniref:acetylxylan esterase n=1 Tax=Victivallis vadensis TaxID=172901 RepID=UPI00266D20A6|nr:acetylxylan esterase [Victivallis vadensis]